MRKPRSYSRLKKIRQRQAVRAIFISLTAIAALFLAIFRYGIPLMIKMAVYISEKNPAAVDSSPSSLTILSAPVFNALPDATNSAKLLISGYGPPKLNLTVYVNNRPIKDTLISETGEFESLIGLDLGENSISAVAVGDGGHQSPPSKVWTVIRDNQPPTITISSPENNTAFHGSQNNRPAITGATDASRLLINEKPAVISADGKFSFPTELSEGENHFIITAGDQAGNETTETLVLFWQP